MAQSGYTPILIYASGTATNVPLAANMTSSASGAELALNYADGKLYYKNSSGVVTLLAGSGGGGPAAGSNTQVQYNNGGVFGASANMTFDGTTLTVAGLSNTGNTTLGNASADTLTVNSTITSNLIFTDNTYDIGASGATRPRNLFTSGTGTFGGTLYTQSLYLGNSRIVIRDNSIEEYAANSNSIVAVNYTGYLAGTTQFRDFDIYNGKSGFIATFEGATSRFGLNNQNPSYLFDMTGQGRVLSGSGASGATIPANNLFVIDSSANAGFGLAIPSTGNIVGGFYVNAGTNQYDGGIDYQGTTRTLNLRSAGASRVIVDSAGSVGVGAAPTSSGRLSLQITDAAEGYYLSNVRTALGVNFVYNANNLYIGSNYASYFELDGTSGAFKWFNAPTGTAGGTVTFTQTMTLETGGNLVIGATSAATKLDVVKQGNSSGGTIMMSGSKTNAAVKYGALTAAHYTSSTYTQGFGLITGVGASSDNNVQIGGGVDELLAATNIRFWTAANTTTGSGTQRVIINSAGNVGIGTDTPDSSMGTGLHIATASGNSLILQKSTGAAMQFRSDASTIRATITGINGADGVYIAYGASQTQTALFNAYGMGLGSASPSSGIGIAFPATQSQSSNANTLDDYEEGSWTPNLAFNGNTAGITYIYRTGTYVKIGRQVTVWATVYLSSKGSNTGDATFISLPYQPDQTFYNEQHGCVGELNGVTFSGYLESRVGGTATVNIFQQVSGTGFSSLTNTSFTDSASMAFTVTYTTNA